MQIAEFVGLDPRIQKETAKAAIKKNISEERQIDCVLMIDNELPLFVEFLKATKILLNGGARHYGARSIVEHLRFHTAAQGKDHLFKINNNLPPLMARVALALFDELIIEDKPFFECRSRDGMTTDPVRAA